VSLDEWIAEDERDSTDRYVVFDMPPDMRCRLYGALSAPAITITVPSPARAAVGCDRPTLADAEPAADRLRLGLVPGHAAAPPRTSRPTRTTATERVPIRRYQGWEPAAG
jgi:hypothetical protein